MRVTDAVRAIESTVSASQEAIAKYFDGNIANAQIRAELEGIWQSIKVISSAIDAESVSVHEPVYIPSTATIDEIVANAARLAAEDAANQPSKKRAKRRSR